MPNQIVGTAYVRIRALTEKVKDDISKGIKQGTQEARADSEKSGEQTGQSYGKGFNEGVKKTHKKRLSDEDKLLMQLMGRQRMHLREHMKLLNEERQARKDAADAEKRDRDAVNKSILDSTKKRIQEQVKADEARLKAQTKAEDDAISRLLASQREYMRQHQRQLRDRVNAEKQALRQEEQARRQHAKFIFADIQRRIRADEAYANTLIKNAEKIVASDRYLILQRRKVFREMDKLLVSSSRSVSVAMRQQIQTVQRQIRPRWLAAGGALADNFVQGFAKVVGSTRTRHYLAGLLIALIIPAIGGVVKAAAAYVGELTSLLASIGPAIAVSAAVGGTALIALAQGFGSLAFVLSGDNKVVNDFKETIAELTSELQMPIQRNILPQLESQFERFIRGPLGTLFQRTIEQSSQIFVDFIDRLQDLGENNTLFRSNLQLISQNNVGLLKTFSDTAFNLVQIFADLLATAGPLTQEFANWTRELTGGWLDRITEMRESGGLSKMFAEWGESAKVWGRIIGNSFEGIGNIFRAAEGAGEALQTRIDTLMQRFVEWTGSTEGQNRMTTFFENSSRIVQEINGFLGDMFQAIGEGVIERPEGIIDFVAGLRDALPSIIEMSQHLATLGPAVLSVVEAIAGLIQTMAQEGALDAFIQTIETITDVFGKLFEIPVVKDLLAWSLSFLAIGKAINIVTLGGFSKLLKHFTVFQRLGSGVSKSFELIGKGFRGLGGAMANLFRGGGPGGGIGGAITRGVQGAKSAASMAGSRISGWIADGVSGAKSVLSKAGSAVVSGVGTGISSARSTLSRVGSTMAGALGTAVTSSMGLFSKIGSNIAGFVGAGISAGSAAIKTAGGAISTALGGISKAFNVLRVAILTNPIGLIITALVLLGVALFTAYKKSETFRNIVNAVFEKVKQGAKAFWDFLKMIFDAIVAAFQWVWEQLQRIGKLIIAGFVAILTFAGTLRDGVVRAWQVLRDGVLAVADWVWVNILQPLISRFQAIWDKAVSIKNGIVSAFGAIRDGVASAYRWVRDNVIAPLISRFQSIWDKAVAVKDGIVGAFNTIKDGVTNALKTLWSGVKVPINVVIGGINEGIIDPINAITGVFGVKKIGKIDKLNQGGVVSGGGPDRDSKLVAMTPGEGVLTRRRTRELGGKAGIKKINDGDYSPFAQGGSFDIVGDWWERINLVRNAQNARLEGWLKQGAAFALGKVIDAGAWGIEKLGGGGWAADWIANALRHFKEKIVEWGRGKDNEREDVSGKAPGKIVKNNIEISFPLRQGTYRIGRGPGPHGYAAWDFPSPMGTPVYAPWDGRLVKTSLGNRSYGNYVRVRHPSGLQFLGAHLSRFSGAGSNAFRGQVIGFVGSTGNSTGPHLHVEVRENGNRVDPRKWFRFGGVGRGVTRFADGGIAFGSGVTKPVGRMAQIASAGSNILWGEPETGGEAYIPLGINKRQRSRKILHQVASRFNYRLVPRGGFRAMADGGIITNDVSSSSGASGSTRQIVINADGPLAAAYAKELASEVIKADRRDEAVRSSASGF